MALPARRVAVIGAGPAGAIAMDSLAKEQSFEKIRLFERRDQVGGTWVLSSNDHRGIPDLQALIDEQADPQIEVPQTFPATTPARPDINSPILRYSDSAAHENLHSNLPPGIMAFTQEPIPEERSESTVSQYGSQSSERHREVIKRWIENIFDTGGYRDLVQLNTTVELAQKVEGEWVLTLRSWAANDVDNVWWQERFDAVVVATGHYNIPFIPNIQGLVDFDKAFPGKIRHSKHYGSALDYQNKRVVVIGGSVSAFDALHDIRKVTKYPVISSLRRPSPLFGMTPFSHPDIIIRPQITSFNADTGSIWFEDGSSVDNIDHVLFATGYEFSFPFLSGIKQVNKRIPGLYEHTFKADDPSIAFIGMVFGGFGLRIFEWQAVAVARVFSGRATLPSLGEMRRWEDRRVDERGDGPAFWILIPEFRRYYEALRAIAGAPAPGTTGRVLPEYDDKWGEEFWKLVDYKIARWKSAALRRQVEIDEAKIAGTVSQMRASNETPQR